MSGQANWRHLVAAFAVSQTITFVALISVFPIVLSAMADDLDVSRPAIALASTISTLAGAATAFPVGRLLDRRGGRMTMTVGSILGVAAVVLWSQAETLTQLYLAFALLGVAQAMSMYEAAFAVLIVATGPEHRDRSILSMTMIAGLTTYLASPLLGWLEVEFGWRSTLLMLAAALALIAVPSHLAVIPPQRVHQGQVRHRSGVSLRAALRQRSFWLMAVAFTVQAGATSAFLLLLVTYLVDIGHPMVVATTIPVAIGVLQVVSRLALTTVARNVRIVHATVVAFAVQGFGMVLLPLVGLSVTLTVLCVAAVGLGNGIGVIARPVIVADAFGTTQFASIMAAVAIPTALSRAGLPVGAAWLGDWRYLVICGLLSLAAAAALSSVSARPRNGSARE